jgi:tetratricopeptide (TPR) repeat protein
LLSARRAFGIALRNEQKTTESISVLEEARAVLHAANQDNSLDAADLEGALADSYVEAGRGADALRLDENRLSTVRSRVGTAGLRYFDTLRDLAHVNDLLGHNDAAERQQREVVAGYMRIYGGDAQALIDAEGDLAEILNSEDKVQEAVEWGRRVVESFRGRTGPDNPDFAISLSNFGELLEQVGSYTEALPYLRESYEITRRHYGDSNLETYIVRANIGRLLTLMGRGQEALSWLLPELPASMEGDSARRARARRLKLLGDCYVTLDRDALARQGYDQAETAFKEYAEPGDDVFLTVDAGRAHLLIREHRYQEALPIMRRVVEGYRRGDPAGSASPPTLGEEMQLAETLVALGQTDEATSLVKSRIQAIEQLSPAHPANQSLQRLRPKLRLRT